MLAEVLYNISKMHSMPWITRLSERNQRYLRDSYINDALKTEYCTWVNFPLLPWLGMAFVALAEGDC